MDWRPFDIKSFLKASRHWDEDIQKLQEELDDLPLLPSSSDVPASKTGTPSDITARAVMRRVEILARIEEINGCKEMLGHALKSLPAEDLALILGFYYPKKTISFFVQDYGQEHGMGRTTVYTEKTRVEDTLARFIEQEFYY